MCAGSETWAISKSRGGLGDETGQTSLSLALLTKSHQSVYLFHQNTASDPPPSPAPSSPLPTTRIQPLYGRKLELVGIEGRAPNTVHQAAGEQGRVNREGMDELE